MYAHIIPLSNCSMEDCARLAENLAREKYHLILEFQPIFTDMLRQSRTVGYYQRYGKENMKA